MTDFDPWADYPDPEWLDQVATDPGDEPDLDLDPPEPPKVRPRAPVGVGAWRMHGASVVFDAPFPDVNWLLPEFELAPGRPAGFWGAPGSGKNFLVQNLALSVAAGVQALAGPLEAAHPAAGRVARRGRVLHITYDMGLRPTALVYRQLANGMGLTREQLAGQLSLSVHPQINLTSPDASRHFAEIMAPYDLVILDNLRDAAPGVDENDSQFGSLLATFGAAAEAVDATAIYLHHTAKSTRDARIGAGRGTSAVPAASGAVWLIQGEGNEARRVVHLRSHDLSVGLHEPLTLHLEAVPDPPGGFDTGDYGSWLLTASGGVRVTDEQLDCVRGVLARRPDLAGADARAIARVAGTRGITADVVAAALLILFEE